MKYTIFTLLLTLLLSLPVFSQHHTDSNATKWNSNNSVRTELIQSIVGLKAIEYERVVSQKFSLLMAYSWGTINGENKEIFTTRSFVARGALRAELMLRIE